MRIALGQMEVVWGDWDGNVMRAHALVNQAARQGAQWIILPEMWACGFVYEELSQLALRTPDLLAEMTRWTKQWRIGIVGTLPEKAKQGLFNTAFVVQSEGGLAAKYRKIHLFASMEEDRFLRAGDRPLLYTWGGASIGMMICYDLRFPELARWLAIRGAEMFWISAHWPHPRLGQWRTLLCARALENQVYVLAANAVARQGEVHFFGHSMAVNPWGEVMVEGGENPELLWIDIDMERVKQDRHVLPVLEARRPEIYGVGSAGPFGDKVSNENEAIPKLEEARNRGQTIVFTNGCFDLLHAGHVSCLERAKSLGDLLVVGINTDDSVREIKGPQRPIVGLEERSQVLAGLSSVDMIVPFAEPDPRRLIAQLRPHVIVKGQDWAEDEIVGGDLVRSWGGRVVRIPLLKGISSSLIVERIQGSRHQSTHEGGQ